MRNIVAQIQQNLGNNVTGAANAVTLTGLVTRYAELEQQIDEQLSKIASGELTVEIIDLGDAIWTFLNDSTQTGNGLLPPWFFLIIDGAIGLTGLLDPSRVTQHISAKTHSVEVCVATWDIALATTYLGAPTALPWQGGAVVTAGQQVMNGSNTYVAVTGGTTEPPPWSAIGVYTAGNRVVSAGYWWTAVTPVTGTAPAAGAWTQGIADPATPAIGPIGVTPSPYLPWAAGTTYAAGYTCCYSGNLWQAVTPITGTAPAAPAWTNLGPGYSSLLDGTVYWAFVPPSWQRPVPQAATQASSAGQVGFSGPWNLLEQAQGLTFAFFNLPSAWIYTGAVLQYATMPIFTITLPTVATIQFPTVHGGGPPNYGTVYTDQNGQQWTYEATGGGTWVLTRSWNIQYDPSLTGATGSSAALSPAQVAGGNFPVGMTISVSGNGVGPVQYQVNAGGTAWVSVYNTTPPATYFKVAAVTSPNGWYKPSAFYNGALGAQFTSLPWPANKNNAQWVAPFCGATAIPGQWQAQFEIAAPLAQDLEYWPVMQAVPESPATPCYQVYLGNVNGIVPGDGMQLVNGTVSASWKAAGVDPILGCVNTVDPVSNLPLASEAYWDAQSQLEFVNEDAVKMLHLVCAPYGCDTSRFSKPVTPNPMFSWLPLRPAVGNDLFACGDIEAEANGSLKVMTGANWIHPPVSGGAGAFAQPSNSWTGNPDTGWTMASPAVVYAPYADWTSQVGAAPSLGGGSTLMPYEVSTAGSSGYNPWVRLRNRAYSDSVYRRENNGLMLVVISGVNYWVNGGYVQCLSGAGTGGAVYQYQENGVVYQTSGASVNFTPYQTIGANVSGGLVVYDYTVNQPYGKRYLFTVATAGGGSKSNYSQVAVQSWNGSAWGTATAWNWPGSNVANQPAYVQSAVPFIQSGLAAGDILGYLVFEEESAGSNGSWPAATTSGDVLQLVNASGGLLAAVSVPSVLVGANLVTTPWATYLVGGWAIARVSYSGGVLTLTTMYLGAQATVLFANTLTAIDQDRFLIFGRQDVPNGSSTTTTTWLFVMDSSLSNSLANSILWSEQVGQGVPATLGCVRDPSKPGRVVGHYGGSLFQVDTERPLVVERWVPQGMTAAEALEHIAQVFAAILVPDATGTMHVVSRTNTDTPTNLNVLIESADNTWGWKDYASIVSVTSSDGNFYYPVWSEQNGIYQLGGKSFALQNHPMCWSMSGAAAMAYSWSGWVGKPRSGSNQAWFYPDPDTAPPWESIQLFDLITVNGGTTDYRPMRRVQDFVKGTCKIEMLTDD